MYIYIIGKGSIWDIIQNIEIYDVYKNWKISPVQLR